VAAPVATYAVFNSPTDTPRTFITAIGRYRWPTAVTVSASYIIEGFATAEFGAYCLLVGAPSSFGGSRLRTTRIITPNYYLYP